MASSTGSRLAIRRSENGPRNRNLTAAAKLLAQAVRLQLPACSLDFVLMDLPPKSCRNRNGSYIRHLMTNQAIPSPIWHRNYDEGVAKSLAPYPDRTLLDYLRETATTWP